jgi:nucleotide-binding universal stress UspA family protein
VDGPIIVGVDGSETASAAAKVAGDLARGLGVGVHCVSAYDKNQSFSVAEGSDQWDVTSHDRAQQLANQAAASQIGQGVDVTWAGVVGKPADVLIEEAARLDATMIVVGNRRMQGLGRVLGSVANSVAHGAPCDVYIVKTT